ncbi:MAG: hypothetical protein E4H27_01835, partial [Anaerolineales bacterium]
VQTLSFGNLDHLQTGQLLVRATSDINQVQMILMMGLRILTRAPLWVAGSVTMLVITAPRLAWLWLAMLPLILGCAFFGVEPTPLPWIPTVTPEPVTPTPTVDIPVFNPPTATQTATSPNEDKTPLPDHTPTEIPILTQTPSPTPQPTPTATPGIIPQVITVMTPIENAIVDNPIQIKGTVANMPFEGTLVVRVFDRLEQLVAEIPMIAQGELGGPGGFEASIAYGGSPGAGRIEIFDFSPKDGSILASATVNVTLGGFAGGGYFEVPQPQTNNPLPLYVLARTGIPGQDVNVVLEWVDGTKIIQTNKVLQGKDGRGMVITTLDSDPAVPYPHTQQAVVSVLSETGLTLAQQQIQILGANDPNSMATNVFWVVGENVQAQAIVIPRTLGIGRASLEALLWGPAPNNSLGYTTAIPTASDVLSYQGRTANWGERVVLNSLAIIDGIAHVDFSIELTAHPGGAMRTGLIKAQIEQTLLQFSTVNGVSITIDGRDGLLEP